MHDEEKELVTVWCFCALQMHLQVECANIHMQQVVNGVEKRETKKWSFYELGGNDLSFDNGF